MEVIHGRLCVEWFVARYKYCTLIAMYVYISLECSPDANFICINFSRAVSSRVLPYVSEYKSMNPGYPAHFVEQNKKIYPLFVFHTICGRK